MLAAWYYGDTGVGAGAYAVHNWNPDPGAAVGIEYDETGNMVVKGSDTLVWDADNRLGFYDTSTGTDTGMVYDVDGNRILRVHGSTTTTYIGGVYETDGTTTTSYYTFAGDTVGFREHTTTSDDRFYVTGDHIGSTATATVIDASDVDNPVDQYYYPYGEPRTTWAISTDRAYTGQTSDHDQTGFYHYNARYYDPEIHRFISADTIIPNPANPQTLNRYPYVGNNPVRYTDPSGHCASRSWALENLAANLTECSNRILRWGDETAEVITENPVASLGLEVTGINDAWRALFREEFLSGEFVSDRDARIASAVIAGGAAGRIARLVGVLKYADEAADLAAGAFRVSNRSLDHIIDSHTGLGSVGHKSTFFDGEDIIGLIGRAGDSVPVVQPNGNLAYVTHADEVVGVDMISGLATDIYTVIADIGGNVVTAFPGIPYAGR